MILLKIKINKNKMEFLEKILNLIFFCLFNFQIKFQHLFLKITNKFEYINYKISNYNYYFNINIIMDYS